MGSQQGNDDGSIAELPWASVFDPAANARVLSAVQARGFRAATEVVNRFVRLAATDPAADADAPAAKPEGPGTDARVDADSVLAGWQKVAGRLAQSLTATAPTTQPDRVTMDFGSASATGQLMLAADQPGAAQTEVWLHNGSATDMGKVRLRCSDLLAHDGAVVSSAAVCFEPDVVPMYARSSRGVTMQVAVTDDVRPGSYRGTLLADGHEHVWLPVVLVVASPAP